jgi:hypothetical protein
MSSVGTTPEKVNENDVVYNEQMGEENMKLDSVLSQEQVGGANMKSESVSSHNTNLVYDNDEEEPELHAKTYIALAAMFLLNFVQVLALQGPPAVVSARVKSVCVSAEYH